MTLAAVKEKLHDYIDHADDKKVKAMFTLVESDIEPDYEFTDADLEELNRRRDDLGLHKQTENDDTALNDSKKGMGHPHEEVTADLRKRYNL